LFWFFVYARFLVTSIASIAPIMIMIMAIATIPYSTVVFEAKPVTGAAVGAVDDDGELA
jgi:hypothetical protein